MMEAVRGRVVQRVPVVEDGHPARKPAPVPRRSCELIFEFFF